MRLFKSFVLTGLMAVVAYGVYATIVKGPATQTTAGSSAPLWPSDPPPGPVEVTPGEPMPAPQAQPLPSEPATPPTVPSYPEFELPPAPGAVGDSATPGTPPANSRAEAGGIPSVIAPGMPGNLPDDSGQPPVGQYMNSGSPGTSNALATPSPTASGSVGNSSFDEVLQAVQVMIASNQLAEAHIQLSRWYTDRAKLGTEREQILLDLLDRLAGAVIYSPTLHLESPHVVQPGETLETIAAQYGVTPRLMEKINRIPNVASVRPGAKLKVVRGPFNAEVNLTRFEMTLFLEDGRYAGRFPIGLGKEVEATEGDYMVTDKSFDPVYRIEQNGAYHEIRGGDPNNPLGNRLVELGTQLDQPGELAIHGTNNPQTVGTMAHEGCIRLNPRDADDVYDILSKGMSKVIIRR